MRKGLFIPAMTLAVFSIPTTVAAAKVFDVTLVACSTLGPSVGPSVCFGGGGALTLRKGSVEVDDDGDVRVSLKGIEGTTATALQPPYTLGLLFFQLPATGGGATSASLVGAFTTDHNGNFTGVVGSVSGPTLGFFVISSEGTDHGFDDFNTGARQQLVTAIPPLTVP